MTTAYATRAELASFLPANALTGVDEAEQDRLLARASELLDDRVTAPFDVDDETDLPADTDVAAALRDACAAQIEFWLEVGEDHDVSGMANRQASVGHLQVQGLPPELAPRARRLLQSAGLLSTASSVSTARRFFATQAGS